MLKIYLFKIKNLVILLLPLFLLSCATFFGNNNHHVKINSTPAGASVYMDNVYYGKTPMTIVVPRVEYDDIMLVVKKDGYQDTNVMVGTQFQNVGYWNFIVLPSFLFDFATGCMFEVKPGEYQVNMVPLAVSESHIMHNESSTTLLNISSAIESKK